MPLDPQAQAVVDAILALDWPPPGTVTPQQYRDQMAAAPVQPGPEVEKVYDRTVPGPAGEIPVRIYTPKSDGPLPVLVYFHGGGWVVGTIDGNWDGTVRHLVDLAGCAAVSVDYRLAPEHKFQRGRRTVTQPRSGSPTTPRLLGWTAAGLPWLGIARAATCPPWCR